MTRKMYTWLNHPNVPPTEAYIGMYRWCICDQIVLPIRRLSSTNGTMSPWFTTVRNWRFTKMAFSRSKPRWQVCIDFTRHFTWSQQIQHKTIMT